MCCGLRQLPYILCQTIHCQVCPEPKSGVCPTITCWPLERTGISIKSKFLVAARKDVFKRSEQNKSPVIASMFMTASYDTL